MALSGRPLPAAVLSADDVPELVQEILDLRYAVAARPIEGQAVTLREAVRTEVITMCAEYGATLNAVRALHAPVQQGRVYCGYVEEDRPDCRTCYLDDGGLGEGHERTICGHCGPVRTFSFTGDPEWPCATAKLLQPAGDVAL